MVWVWYLTMVLVYHDEMMMIEEKAKLSVLLLLCFPQTNY